MFEGVGAVVRGWRGGKGVRKGSLGVRGGELYGLSFNMVSRDVGTIHGKKSKKEVGNALVFHRIVGGVNNDMMNCFGYMTSCLVVIEEFLRQTECLNLTLSARNDVAWTKYKPFRDIYLLTSRKPVSPSTNRARP